MPTLFTHPIIPLAISAGLGKEKFSKKLILLSMLFSIFPDIDVIAFKFGIPYSSQFGHRGFTHSLFFAVILSMLLAYLLSNRLQASRQKVFIFLFIAMGSHGLLDMLTDGGLGIALLWPFTDERYFAPFQVVTVSPIGMGFFSEWGANTLISEFFWIWLPSLLMTVTLFAAIRISNRIHNES